VKSLINIVIYSILVLKLAIIQTPIGVLETNIPTIYGEKHQFRSFEGNVFDIPDWLGWAALVVGLVGGGALGGYVAWHGRGLFNIGQSAKGMFGDALKFLNPKKSGK